MERWIGRDGEMLDLRSVGRAWMTLRYPVDEMHRSPRPDTFSCMKLLPSSSQERWVARECWSAMLGWAGRRSVSFRTHDENCSFDRVNNSPSAALYFLLVTLKIQRKR